MDGASLAKFIAPTPPQLTINQAKNISFRFEINFSVLNIKNQSLQNDFVKGASETYQEIAAHFDYISHLNEIYILIFGDYSEVRV